MNPPDRPGLSPHARDGDGPVFDEPWQAQILAIADALVARELITPAEWSRRLGAALRRAEAAGEPDSTETYYRAVTRAVEDVLADRGDVAPETVTARMAAWTRAYERTPHGQPVDLDAGGEPGPDGLLPEPDDLGAGRE